MMPDAYIMLKRKRAAVLDQRLSPFMIRGGGCP